MPEIRDLFDLQFVDLEVDQRSARLEEIGRLLGDDRALKAARAKQTTLGKQAEEIASRQQDFDLAIATFSQRIEAAETKLYNGTVTNSRELGDLQADIGMLKRQRGEEEERLLYVLEELDQTEGELRTLTTKLTAAERKWESDQACMTEERDGLQREIAELSVKRNAMASRVPPADLALYTHVRKRHAGHAVAIMRDGTCVSCRVALPNKLASDVRAAKTPVRCPSCGLIMLAG